MKKYFQIIKQDYINYVHPKWRFWCSLFLLLSCLIIGVGGSIFFLPSDFLLNDKLIRTILLTLFSIGLYFLSIDLMYHFVDKNKEKEYRERQQRFNKIRNELKNIYFNDIMKNDENKFKVYNEISDEHKDKYLEFMFNLFITKEENFEYLKNIHERREE